MKGNCLYRERAKEVIREFLQREGRISYEKKQSSSYQGFMYLKKEASDKVFAFDILLPDEGTMVFEAAIGIHVSNMAFVPTVTRYCQEKIRSNCGSVQVQGADIVFRAMDCMMENPISFETLEKYEKEAIRVLELHHDNLSNLALGRSLSISPVEEPRSNCTGERYDSSNQVAVIREFLSSRAHHNAVCEKMDENNNTVFYCQVKTRKDSFKFSFDFSDDGILTLKGTFGDNAFVVPEEYRYAVADYINDENSKRKYAALTIGAPGEGVSCNVSTSIMDGIIGDKTIEFMEQIVTKMLSDTVQAIETIGAGFIFKDDKTDRMMEELAKIMLEDDEGNNPAGYVRSGGVPKGVLPGFLEPIGRPRKPVRPSLEAANNTSMSEFTPDEDGDELSMSEFAETVETTSDDESDDMEE